MELTAKELQDRIDRVKMMPGKLLLRRCIKPDIKDEAGNVIIELIPHTKEQHDFMEVIKIGPDVVHEIQPGDICNIGSWNKKQHLLRDFPEGRTWTRNPDTIHEYYVADQAVIDFVVEDFHPIPTKPQRPLLIKIGARNSETHYPEVVRPGDR